MLFTGRNSETSLRLFVFRNFTNFSSQFIARRTNEKEKHLEKADQMNRLAIFIDSRLFFAKLFFASQLRFESPPAKLSED